MAEEKADLSLFHLCSTPLIAFILISRGKRCFPWFLRPNSNSTLFLLLEAIFFSAKVSYSIHSKDKGEGLRVQNPRVESQVFCVRSSPLGSSKGSMNYEDRPVPTRLSIDRG